MVLDLLHINSELAQVLNKLVLLLHHYLDLLLGRLVGWNATVI